MKIYRSNELGAAELQKIISTQPGGGGLIFNSEPLGEDELLASGFDVIELPEAQMQSLLKKFVTLNWNIQSSRALDCFLKINQQYVPYQVNAEVLESILANKKIRVDISSCAVLIGDYSFVASFAAMLGKLGYKKIFLISPEDILFSDDLLQLKKIMFDVEVQQLSFDELATISQNASFLGVDFELALNPDLVEILTYFNFLTEGSIFFDLRSFLDDSLSSEAEKVQLTLVDIVEFYTLKYKYIQNLQNKLNNRSKV